jgi:oligopeptide/dipeptide ABC transporter ATP-binding protein
MSGPVLTVRDLRKYFPVRSGFFGQERKWVRAVDGVSFDLHAGETLGLVGESGCGKSTTGRVILRLMQATSGEVHFRGQDVFAMGAEDLRRFRRRVQIVFQDPYSSLNPRMTVRQTLGEVLTVHRLGGDRSEREKRIRELLDLVGLRSEHADRYPHEFSGGQRQRIGIARALAVEPEVIVCDEPVSALDVSVQAQVVNLLKELQRNLGLAYLFISHDLSLVEHVSDRVAVMYLGRIVESGPAASLYRTPLHPYTQALLSAAPRPTASSGGERRRILLEGDIPSPISPPPGCAFHPRCNHPLRDGECTAAVPPVREMQNGHEVRCIRAVKTELFT